MKNVLKLLAIGLSTVGILLVILLEVSHKISHAYKGLFFDGCQLCQKGMFIFYYFEYGLKIYPHCDPIRNRVIIQVIEPIYNALY